MIRILIVGTMNGQVGAASQIAIKRGARVSLADSVSMALDLMRTGQGGDLILMDTALDIKALIQGLNAERIAAPVVACGVETSSRIAATAIKAGAREFIPLPPDPELIAAVLAAVSEEEQNLIGDDPSMKAVIRMAEQIAPSNANIMITGESGTGKEVMARYLHEKSNRVDKIFVAVNCAAIPENLLESELFGHEKGAFTGAVARRTGKFEEANGGTLLLDEISEMDVRLQAKLLRAIQEKEIDRVGGNRPVPVDVRIVATSNRNLPEEVKKGTFREDLLFRLNVVNLKLPPLRDRPSDIEPLAKHFIKKFSDLNGVPEHSIDRSALPYLTSYPWPGNVRELENTMHRAVLLTTGSVVDTSTLVLPDGTRLDQTDPQMTDKATGSGGPSDESDSRIGMTVAEVERDLIIDTLKHCFGNRTHAATILGISIRTLRNKLKQYSGEGLSIPNPTAHSDTDD